MDRTGSGTSVSMSHTMAIIPASIDRAGAPVVHQKHDGKRDKERGWGDEKKEPHGLMVVF